VQLELPRPNALRDNHFIVLASGRDKRTR